MTLTATALPVESGLVVADADRSVDFYGSVLGFTEFRRVKLDDFTHEVGLGAPGRLVWVRSPSGQVVKFYDGGAGSAYIPPAAAPDGPVHHFLSVYVADLLAALTAAEAAGATRHTEPKTLATGVQMVFLHDPDGHVLELVQRPAAPGTD